MAIRPLTEQRALEIVRKIPDSRDYKVYYLENPSIAVQLVAFAMATQLDFSRDSWADVAHFNIKQHGTAGKAMRDYVQGFREELSDPEIGSIRVKVIMKDLRKMQVQMKNLDALLGYGE